MTQANVRDLLLVEAAKPFSELLPAVERGRAALLANLEGVTEPQARYKPDAEAGTTGDATEDAWCIDEVLRHLIFACSGAAERIARLAAGQPAEGALVPGVLGANEGASLRRLMEGYNEAHDRLEAVLRSLTGQEHLAPTAPHVAFGDLNCRAWGALYGRHLASHARQGRGDQGHAGLSRARLRPQRRLARDVRDFVTRRGSSRTTQRAFGDPTLAVP